MSTLHHTPPLDRGAPPADAPRRGLRALSLPEFVALMAMLTATIAVSIDAMLPGLPQIGAELSPADPNAAQLVIVTFVLGMGAGTLFVGPLSDAVGRKTVMVGGAAIYCLGAGLAAIAPSLELLLAARLLQGLGASGPRVAAMGMIRDLYSGRGMARVQSFVMMTFTLIPAVAPLMGSWIIAGFGWRGVFGAFVLFSLLSGGWLLLRQPETLPPERRRPMRLRPLLRAAREVLAHPVVRRSVIVQTLIFAVLFGCITSVQPLYEQTFDRADTFPYWFFGVAIVSGSASFLNARIVGRLGMVYILRRALIAHLALSAALLGGWLLGPDLDGPHFALFLLWQVGTFALAGLTIGNLNAIAMQPMGHIAGMASSVISALSTIVSVLLAAPIGQAFDGTPVPLAGAALVLIGLAALLSARLHEGPAT